MKRLRSRTEAPVGFRPLTGLSTWVRLLNADAKSGGRASLRSTLARSLYVALGSSLAEIGQDGAADVGEQLRVRDSELPIECVCEAPQSRKLRRLVFPSDQVRLSLAKQTHERLGLHLLECDGSVRYVSRDSL